MKKLITTAVIIAFGFVANAQVSRYLEKGQSGVGIRLGAEKTYGEYGFSGQVGGSIKGVIDIEFSYTKDMYDTEKLDLLKDNVHSALYEGWVNWWVIRKQIIPVIDINLAVWGEYANGVYTDYLAPDDTTSYLYNGYNEGQLGFELAVNFRITNTWWVQPGFFAYYAIGQENWDEKGQKVKNNYQGLGSSIGIGVIKRLKQNSLYFQFNQYFDSYQGSTGKYKVSIGYIIGWSKVKK